MFGYVQYDIPNLYIKDLTLYRALYCGLCKGIGVSCGQRARMGLSYDMTLLSALFHNLRGEDIRIERQNCFEHTLRKRPIAAVDPLTEELGALNTVLVYYKLTDDILDGGRGRARRAFFRKGFQRAKKKYPALVLTVENYMKEQAASEEKGTGPDRAAEPSACMLRTLSRHFLGNRATESTDGMFYCIGKWVYLIDALDDYDKDLKKRQFNPFIEEYGSGSRAELMKEHGNEVHFLFDTLFFGLRESMAGVRFCFNRDLTDNILLRGLPAVTQRVMEGVKSPRMRYKV